MFSDIFVFLLCCPYGIATEIEPWYDPVPITMNVSPLRLAAWMAFREMICWLEAPMVLPSVHEFDASEYVPRTVPVSP